MLKSTAAVIGFLFGLSTAYYLSFWSFFNINVFQYMAVEDIIKGIAYPLRYGGVWILGVALFAIILLIIFILSVAPENVMTSNEKKIFGLLIFFSLLSSISYLLFADSLLLGMILSVLMSIIVFEIYNVINMPQNTKTANKVNTSTSATNHLLTEFSEHFVAYCIIFLSINAIISGQIEARAIHSGKRYSYIVSNDLPRDKVKTAEPYLIFLGAVSEKYILIDRKENERFILDKDELPDLKIHYYDSTDPSSTSHFNRALGKSLGLSR